MANFELYMLPFKQNKGNITKRKGAFPENTSHGTAKKIKRRQPAFLRMSVYSKYIFASLTGHKIKIALEGIQISHTETLTKAI